MRRGRGPSRATHGAVDSAHEVRVGVVGQRLIRSEDALRETQRANKPSAASGRDGRREGGPTLQGWERASERARERASEGARAGGRASGMRLAVHESKVNQTRRVRGRERTSTFRVWRCTLGDAE